MSVVKRGLLAAGAVAGVGATVYAAERAACVQCPVTIPEKFRWSPPRLLLLRQR